MRREKGKYNGEGGEVALKHLRGGESRQYSLIK